MRNVETMNQLREANRALGRLLGSREGRRVLRRNGYDSSRRIRPILESQPLDDLLHDIRLNGGAVVAVYFPEKHGIDQFEFLEFDDLHDVEEDESEEATTLRLGRNENGQLSTVGMFCSYLARGIEPSASGDSPFMRPGFPSPTETPRVYSTA